jgi:hypothetical protein
MAITSSTLAEKKKDFVHNRCNWMAILFFSANVGYMIAIRISLCKLNMKKKHEEKTTHKK